VLLAPRLRQLVLRHKAGWRQHQSCARRLAGAAQKAQGNALRSALPLPVFPTPSHTDAGCQLPFAVFRLCHSTSGCFRLCAAGRNGTLSPRLQAGQRVAASAAFDAVISLSEVNLMQRFRSPYGMDVHGSKKHGRRNLQNSQ